MIEIIKDVRELQRKLSTLFLAGVALEAQEGNKVFCQIELPSGEVKTKLLVLSNDRSGYLTHIEKGDQVFIVNPFSNITQAIILGVIPRDQDLVAENVIYRQGGIEIRRTKEGFVIGGNLQVDGEVLVKEELQAKDVKSEIGISLAEHLHEGVQTGPGVSGPPQLPIPEDI